MNFQQKQNFFLCQMDDTEGEIIGELLYAEFGDNIFLIEIIDDRLTNLLND